jgi:carbon-monoxide dehydrogenase medium subunit
VLPRFAYARPRSLEEAVRLLSEPDARVHAGGTDLLGCLRDRVFTAGTLVSLSGLSELAGIEERPDGSLRIGARTTLAEVASHPAIVGRFTALAEGAGAAASPQLRNQGTLGGNLCFAEPHSDPATLLLACDARVTLRGPDGERTLPIAAFFVGPFTTAREASEILIDVRVPPAAVGAGQAYEKAKFRERPAVSVAVRLRVDGAAVAEATVAVGSMVDAPVLVPEAAAALVGASADASDERGLAARLATASAALAGLDAVDDLDGSADYKHHLASILLGRAVRSALPEAVGRA